TLPPRVLAGFLMPPSPHRTTLHRCQLPPSRRLLPSAGPQDVPKACLRAEPAIFSCAKPPPPFVPAPQPARPQTPKRSRRLASRVALPPLPRTVLPAPPAFHPSFPLVRRRKGPPPTYSQKPATPKSFPVAKN